MKIDDVIYLLILFFSVGFGNHYRKIENAEYKKKIGALVGFFLMLIVSRLHFLHTVLTITVNALIILYVNKRYCHIVSFAFSFLYLTFFRTTAYFGIPYPPSHTNLIQMILTLKLVGLAFEKRKVTQEQANFLKELTFLDIFYYGLNYIGVLTGPFYSYQTYHDHLSKPFHNYDDYKTVTLKKMIPWLPVYAIVYLLTDYLWPLSYTQDIDFEQRAFLYRYWYIWPTFINFRMRIYIGLILSECVCVMGGMGVYPSFTKNMPGKGPSQNLERLKSLSTLELKHTSYDYETVHSIDACATEFHPTLRGGMRNWNMTVQYWLATNVYKQIDSSKNVKTVVTMFVSAVWHGVYPGYYISFGMIPVGLIVEDIWAKILLENEQYQWKNWKYWIMLFLKMQFFSYSALSFSLLDVRKILHYYNLVYHWMVFFVIAMFFAGKKVLALKRKRVESG